MNDEKINLDKQSIITILAILLWLKDIGINIVFKMLQQICYLKTYKYSNFQNVFYCILFYMKIFIYTIVALKTMNTKIKYVIKFKVNSHSKYVFLLLDKSTTQEKN